MEEMMEELKSFVILGLLVLMVGFSIGMGMGSTVAVIDHKEVSCAQECGDSVECAEECALSPKDFIKAREACLVTKQEAGR